PEPRGRARGYRDVNALKLHRRKLEMVDDVKEHLPAAVHRHHRVARQAVRIGVECHAVESNFGKDVMTARAFSEQALIGALSKADRLHCTINDAHNASLCPKMPTSVMLHPSQARADRPPEASRLSWPRKRDQARQSAQCALRAP